MYNLLFEILKIFFSAILGGLTVLFAPSIRRLFWGPKLKLKFNRLEEGYVAKTPIIVQEAGIQPFTTEGFYVMVMIENKKPTIAKDCRAYLVDIEKLGGNGNFKSTIFCDSIQLQW
jgi:hypothetical protein